MRTVYIYFNTDGYAEQYSSTPGHGFVEFQLPADHGFFEGNWGAYFKQGSNLLLDKAKMDQMLREKEEREKPQKNIHEEIAEVRSLLEALFGTDPKKQLEIIQQMKELFTWAVQHLPDDRALDMPDLFPFWETGENYTIGNVVKIQEDGKAKPTLFKVMRAHKSEMSKEPQRDAVSYKKILHKAEAVTEWVLPKKKKDAYDTGNLVSYKAGTWKSRIDTNMTEPGTGTDWVKQ